MLKTSAPPSPKTSPHRPIQDWISQNHWLILSGTCVAFLLIALWGAVGLFSAGKLPEDEMRSQNVAPSPTVVEPVTPVEPEPQDSLFSLGNLLSLLIVCGVGSWAVIWMLQWAIATPPKPRRKKRPVAKVPRRRPQAQSRPVAPRPQPQPRPVSPRPNPALGLSINRPGKSKSRRLLPPPATAKRSLQPTAVEPQREEAVAVIPAEAVIPLDNRPVSLADSLDIRKRQSLNTLMREPQSLKAPPRRI
ncbi:MAG: hypothetical protein ACLFV6_13520 [Spirulinaceae cyanobacterium]